MDVYPITFELRDENNKLISAHSVRDTSEEQAVMDAARNAYGNVKQLNRRVRNYAGKDLSDRMFNRTVPYPDQMKRLAEGLLILANYPVRINEAYGSPGLFVTHQNEVERFLASPDDHATLMDLGWEHDTVAYVYYAE